MKNSINACIFLVCFLTASCNQKKSTIGNIGTFQIRSNSDTAKKPTTTNQLDNLADFALLSPIDIVNPKSKSAYEKYGIETSGYCYECDLAAISINKKQFDIINICDKKDVFTTEKFTYQSSLKELIITTEKNKFIFTKIDPAPVYELKITGEKISLDKKRISKFYTQQKKLIKFKQHDCGEFDG